eukprot:CAMPEP_0194491914 /NCGR_PEP_ID=MMETSP0253-20130528/10652_1 /TAXON_ID=2966 /ORGANISM="Noctiluca scintillans" /LENGTH=131 /DNA_ID=CAMNT_0039332715 /DNA_START=66 /DNA_END=463 /DNA_ORIENTATION=+
MTSKAHTAPELEQLGSRFLRDTAFRAFGGELLELGHRLDLVARGSVDAPQHAEFCPFLTGPVATRCAGASQCASQPTATGSCAASLPALAACPSQAVALQAGASHRASLHATVHGASLPVVVPSPCVASSP